MEARKTREVPQASPAMERVLPRIEEIFGDLPTLETERLVLRKMRLDDAADLFEYASDPEVSTYTTWGLTNQYRTAANSSYAS